MQRLLMKLTSRRVLSSVETRLGSASCSSLVHKQSFTNSSLQGQLKCQQHLIPGDFLKWSSIGFIRNSRYASGFSPLQPKKLDSIIDIERVKNRSAEDLASIWDDYFVIPLWRGSGYTTMFAQVQMPHMIFTGLEDYKARGTEAAPYFTVSYFTEFVDSKDLVLVRGDVVFTSKLSDSEAKWLLDTAHSFYLNDVRYKLVERFNGDTHEFEFKDVLQALDIPAL